MFLAYSLISSLILLCGWTVYYCAMSGQRQFGLNRVAILIVFVSALLLPLPLMPGVAGGHVASAGSVEVGGLVGGAVVERADALPTFVSIRALRIANGVYVAGFAVMLLRVVWSFVSLQRYIRRHGGTERCGYNLVVGDNHPAVPFSWGRTVVMNRVDYDNCGAMILAHELEHLRRHHWVDLIIAQLVVSIQWYNPAAWQLRGCLRGVHEYQADEAVISAGHEKSEYQRLLIDKALGRPHALADSFSNVKLKKRIIMMYKKESSPVRRRAGALLLVPALAAGCMLASVPSVARVLTGLSETETPTTVVAGGNVMPMGVDSADDSRPVSDKRPDRIAEFPGGMMAMLEFLRDNVTYPEASEKAGEEGKVLVRFVVNTDGSISDAEIQNSVSPLLDAEALRVVGEMPAWTPACHDGAAVATCYSLPINFKLNKKSEKK